MPKPFGSFTEVISGYLQEIVLKRSRKCPPLQFKPVEDNYDLISVGTALDWESYHDCFDN